MSARPALLLDRDGTLVADAGYLADPAGLRLLPGVAAALGRAQAAGYRLIVVSNQSGIARGLVSEEQVAAVHRALSARLRRRGVALDGIYVCPHHPEVGPPPYRADCTCRKPRPGLLLRAGEEHGLDLARSFMVGDRDCDVEAGRAAGCRTVLLARPGDAPPASAPDHVAAGLAAGVEWILGRP
jgi:D-glycero-D-manno-heptose 1,7-bisphosphate phosphatase